MPEWHEQTKWSQMGLWEISKCGNRLNRVLCEQMLLALKEAQRIEDRFYNREAETTSETG
jgi:hypothetical protein